MVSARLAIPLLLSLAACKASVSLKAETHKVDASADASANVDRPAQSAVGPRIARSNGKLAYDGGDIEFATDSAEITGDVSSKLLDEFAAVLKNFPELKIRIEAHTDSRGSKEYNRKLSDDRAAAIKVALVRRGIPGARMTSEGMGEEHPVKDEPPTCRNHAEAGKRGECQDVWAVNRRAEFHIVEGADTLPPEGAVVTASAPASSAPIAGATAHEQTKRPDWALRMFGGYTLLAPDNLPAHGGHLGVGVHASQRFGKHDRGYIGGGPRLHYRGVHHKDATTNLSIHEFGPEGNFLVGGGNKKVVGLFSLRLGFGLIAQKGTGGNASYREAGFAGWVMGGVVVLGKLTPRWSLGGHVETGITGAAFSNILAAPLLEIGINAAWHFGRGRRNGI